MLAELESSVLSSGREGHQTNHNQRLSSSSTGNGSEVGHVNQFVPFCSTWLLHSIKPPGTHSPSRVSHSAARLRTPAALTSASPQQKWSVVLRCGGVILAQCELWRNLSSACRTERPVLQVFKKFFRSLLNSEGEEALEGVLLPWVIDLSNYKAPGEGKCGREESRARGRARLAWAVG